jgi:hypothetical protein
MLVSYPKKEGVPRKEEHLLSDCSQSMRSLAGTFYLESINGNWLFLASHRGRLASVLNLSESRFFFLFGIVLLGEMSGK